MLNKYFQSVFIESTCSAGTLPQMANPVAILSEVTFSANQLTKLHEIVPSSTNVACDGTPLSVWNSCPSTLAGFVQSFFSYIINTNEWPNFWKCAYVTPIFKKGSKSDVENYGPISIMPRLSLVLEKIIFDYLYCGHRSKLSARQHGFRCWHSTITQLLVCLHDIYENFDCNSG